MKRTIFEVFQVKKSINHTMALVTSNLEASMRTKILIGALKDIKSFARSKKQATMVFKRRAAFDVMSTLTSRNEYLL